MRASMGRLAEHWYAAARAEELPRGRPLGRTLLGELLVLFRDERGDAHALADRCLHRNALLSEGVVVGGCVACPYHGWTYDADGRCVNVPSESRDGSPRTELTLEAFPVREEHELIWVYMGPSKRPRGNPFPMPVKRGDGWGSYWMTTRFDNDVPNLVENFMDVPHTVFVHRGWFRTRSRKKVGMSVERTESSVLVTYDQPNDSIGFTRLLANPRRLPMVHTDKYYLPATTRVDYAFGDEARAFIITSTCRPISPSETEVFTLISFKLGRVTPYIRPLLNWYTKKVIHQDVEIMEIQGRSLRHHGAPLFASTPADTLHVHIEALLEWAASEEGPPPPRVVDRVEFWI